MKANSLPPHLYKVISLEWFDLHSLPLWENCFLIFPGLQDMLKCPHFMKDKNMLRVVSVEEIVLGFDFFTDDHFLWLQYVETILHFSLIWLYFSHFTKSTVSSGWRFLWANCSTLWTNFTNEDTGNNDIFFLAYVCQSF